MKALTLTQPYATLVAIGAKHIETRSWSTSYRGPIAIHAGKGLVPVGGASGLASLVAQSPFHEVLALWEPNTVVRPDFYLPRGCVVALAQLDACYPATIRNGRACYCTQVSPRAGHNTYEFISEQEAAFGDYASGRYAWLLNDVRSLPEPIPARGALGLWEWIPPENFAP